MRTEEFNHIILPMRSDLKAYALRLTESDDNAEDLVQEVMLRLWDMRQNIKAEDNLKALAITIMRNKFYDQCRHEERNFATDKVMEVPIEDRRAEQRDEVNLIKQIVAQLPPLQQQIFILVSGALCPPVNAFLKSHLVSAVHLPVLDSTFKFGWISNAGLMLFLGATIGGLVQGLSLKRLMVILARTTVNLRKTVVTICSLIALASVMNYSGMITSIASGLVAVTGDFYPLVAPMIGAIGTFVTGSDTSSNILFAKLQAHVANQLGMTGQSTFFGMEGGQENWLVAANTTGATGGKMISPQSIAIATAACDMEGKDGEILRSAIPYALLYIVLGGLMVYFGC